jgi:Flp pilus assembly pilin Flp
MVRLIRDFGADRKGITLIEYALLAALVATTAITILAGIGVTLKSFYTTISTELSSA